MNDLGTILQSTSKEEIRIMVESAPPMAEGSGLIHIGKKDFYIWNLGDGRFSTQAVGESVSGTHNTDSSGVVAYLFGRAEGLLNDETTREIRRV